MNVLVVKKNLLKMAGKGGKQVSRICHLRGQYFSG